MPTIDEFRKTIVTAKHPGEDEFRKALEKAKKQEFKTQMYDKRRAYGRGVMFEQKQYSMKLFRRIAEKAWFINTIIGHITDKTIPYMRPVNKDNPRGFEIQLKDADAKMSKADGKRAKEITEGLLKANFANYKIDGHNDELIPYTKKIVRDILTLDQATAEQLWTKGNEFIAFEAVDAATILRCNEHGYDGDDKIKFVQMIDSQIVSTYTDSQMLFQYMNPRTDIEHYGYGYSRIEQCVDLVVSFINSFNFNAAAFTDDKLPRGMLLLNGDADFDAVEEIEDYLVDVMSGALGKWSIPIIPSGKADGKATITWQALNQSNQDMQFSRWQDTLYMAIAAVYGVDIESMGIKPEKASKIIDSGSQAAREYSDDKGIGSTLTFLERHFQHYVDLIDPNFAFRFLGFERKDVKDQRENIKSQLETYKTLNQMLREQDLPESDLPWADVPGILNPQTVQLYNANKAQEQTNSNQDYGNEGYEEPDYDMGKSIDDEIIIRI